MPLNQIQTQNHIRAFYEEISAMERMAELIDHESLGIATSRQTAVLRQLRERLRSAKAVLQNERATALEEE